MVQPDEGECRNCQECSWKRATAPAPALSCHASSFWALLSDTPLVVGYLVSRLGHGNVPLFCSLKYKSPCCQVSHPWRDLDISRKRGLLIRLLCYSKLHFSAADKSLGRSVQKCWEGQQNDTCVSQLGISFEKTKGWHQDACLTKVPGCKCRFCISQIIWYYHMSCRGFVKRFDIGILYNIDSHSTIMRRGLAYWICAFFAICLPFQKVGLSARDPSPPEWALQLFVWDDTGGMGPSSKFWAFCSSIFPDKPLLTQVKWAKERLVMANPEKDT